MRHSCCCTSITAAPAFGGPKSTKLITSKMIALHNYRIAPTDTTFPYTSRWRYDTCLSCRKSAIQAMYPGGWRAARDSHRASSALLAPLLSDTIIRRRWAFLNRLRTPPTAQFIVYYRPLLLLYFIRCGTRSRGRRSEPCRTTRDPCGASPSALAGSCPAAMTAPSRYDTIPYCCGEYRKGRGRIG